MRVGGHVDGVKPGMFTVFTGHIFTVFTGHMFTVLTGHMFTVLTGHMFTVLTGHVYGGVKPDITSRESFANGISDHDKPLYKT